MTDPSPPNIKTKDTFQPLPDGLSSVTSKPLELRVFSYPPPLTFVSSGHSIETSPLLLLTSISY
jgi:hypothetical protein